MQIWVFLNKINKEYKVEVIISFLYKLLRIKMLNVELIYKAYISLKDFTFKFKNVGLPLQTQNEREKFFNNFK